MKKSDKIFVVFALVFWAVIGFFFTGYYYFFALPVAGMVWFFLGGKLHV